MTARLRAYYGTAKSWPWKEPASARPLSQVEELSKLDDLSPARAPAAMYFVVSVLPSSTTSGGVLPARAASSLVRWSGQVWYWTLTAVLGCLTLNAVVAAATASGHPCCASVWSQTVIDAGSGALLLLLLVVAPEPPLLHAASATAASAATETSFVRSTGTSSSRVRSARRVRTLPDGRHHHWCRPLGEESVKTTGTVK